MYERTKFQGLFKVGLIIVVIGAAISAIAAWANIKTDYYDTATNSSLFIYGAIQIVLIILGSIALSKKAVKNRVLIAVLAIIFGNIFGIIGGILMLAAEKEQVPIEEYSPYLYGPGTFGPNQYGPNQFGPNPYNQNNQPQQPVEDKQKDKDETNGEKK